MQKTHRNRFLFYGFAIGVGATAGGFAWYFIYAQRDHFLAWMFSEMTRSADIYGYAAVGVIALSSLIGLLLGARADRAAKKTETRSPSFLDPQTGLHSSSRLHEELSHAFESAKRYGTPLTCILFDIDNYKKINDDHGRSVGDQVLAAISEKVKLLSRRADSAGRLNGEEFLLVMPQTSTLSGRVVAERLRKAAANLKFSIDEKPIQVTLSAGVAMFPADHVESKSALLRAAAQALYQAKGTGKNKIVVWQDQTPAATGIN